MDSTADRITLPDLVPGGSVDKARIDALTDGFASSRANRIARNAVTSMGIAAAARDQRAVRAYKDTYGVSLKAAKTVTPSGQVGPLLDVLHAERASRPRPSDPRRG